MVSAERPVKGSLIFHCYNLRHFIYFENNLLFRGVRMLRNKGRNNKPQVNKQELESLFSLIMVEGNEKSIEAILTKSPHFINVETHDVKFKRGCTPLQWAIECENLAYASLMLACCSKHISHDNITKSFYKLIKDDAYEYIFDKEAMNVAIALLKAGANPKSLNMHSQNLLHFAVCNDLSVIPTLIDLGVSPQVPSSNGCQACELQDVYLYAYNNNFIQASDPTYQEIIMDLFKNGYPIDLKDYLQCASKLSERVPHYANYLALQKIDLNQVSENKAELNKLSYIEFMYAKQAIDQFVLIAATLIYSSDEISSISMLPLDILTLILKHLDIKCLPNMPFKTINDFAKLLDSQKKAPAEAKPTTNKLVFFNRQLLKQIDQDVAEIKNSLSKK